MSYAIAGTGVIYELLDDEVILANLNVGIYYSIRGSGVLIWQLLLSGHSPSSIETLFCEKYGKIPPIAPFVNHLLEEELIVPSESALPVPPTLSWPAAFHPPTLERYDEMKNLLALDPIHEVDEQGWPHRK